MLPKNLPRTVTHSEEGKETRLYFFFLYLAFKVLQEFSYVTN